MTRIEPRTLVEAFRKTDKKPIRGDFVNKRGDGCCGLGVTALYELRSQGIHVDRYNVGVLARDRLGLSESYFAGFVIGWDGGLQCDVPDERDATMGYSDGKSCWESCVSEGLVVE